MSSGPLTPISQTSTRLRYSLATELVFIDNSDGSGVKDPYNAASVPIYQSATFKQSSVTQMGEFDYSRSGNPTRSHLGESSATTLQAYLIFTTSPKNHLAKIMSANRAFVVSSGMSALDVITRLVKAGEEIIAGDDLYGGTNRLLSFLGKSCDIKTHHVDTTSSDALMPYLHPTKTRLILLESPTNPLLKISDIPNVASIVHERCPNALVVVDNTMMSPYLQRPLEFGADIVIHSGTKYLSGHHDLMAGVIGVKDEVVAEKIYFTINATGCGLAPFDSWLLLRGIKTLGVRMEKQQANAIQIAEFLEYHGFKVMYPGLRSHPQYGLHYTMSRGPGAVLSFVTGDVEVSERVVESTKIWAISVSFGCVNSLISMPCRMSHASIPAAVRQERGFPEDLIRLCVGIEDVNDLIEDLYSALVIANAVNVGQNNDIQAKVRNATSNDPWGPSGTLMDEIARATYNPNDHLEIMEMIDKRLNDHGKNWRHVFKALTLLDYCLHGGSENVVKYAKTNLYVVKTLTEFQYIDEDGKDQGLNVRQKARDITNLLQDEERLNQERRNRDDMRRRMGGRADRSVLDPSLDRSVEQPGYLDDESEFQKAIEESKRSAQEYEARIKESEKDEVEKALKLSKEEEEQRLAKIAEQNDKPLIDTSGYGNSPFLQSQPDFFSQQMHNQFNQNQYSSTSTTSLYGTNEMPSFNMTSSSNFSSPNLTSSSTFDSFSSRSTQPNFDSLLPSQNIIKPQDEKHAKLASLIGSGGDGMDTFGNIGNRRIPAGSGFASTLNPSSNALSVDSPPPRRSNSTGDIGVTQANPFLNSGGPNFSSSGYNTLPQASGFNQPDTTSNLDIFFSGNNNNTFNQRSNQ
ncbi:16260_t:CDS:10, partial [Funneliformis caledonium]